MDTTKVINLNDYRARKANKNKNKLNQKSNFKIEDEDDRRNTFDLFMRVLETIRQESY